MGVEGAWRSANGGGYPFLHALYIANVHFIRLLPAFVCFLLLEFSCSMSPALLESSGTPKGQKGIESGQKVAKVNKFLVCFGVFSGFSETERGKI